MSAQQSTVLSSSNFAQGFERFFSSLDQIVTRAFAVAPSTKLCEAAVTRGTWDREGFECCKPVPFGMEFCPEHELEASRG